MKSQFSNHNVVEYVPSSARKLYRIALSLGISRNQVMFARNSMQANIFDFIHDSLPRELDVAIVGACEQRRHASRL